MGDGQMDLHDEIRALLWRIGEKSQELVELAVKQAKVIEERLLDCRILADKIKNEAETTDSVIKDYFILSGQPESLRSDCPEHKILTDLSGLIAASVDQPIMIVEVEKDSQPMIHHAMPMRSCFPPMESLLDNAYQYSVQIGFIAAAELSVKSDLELNEKGFSRAWLGVKVDKLAKFGNSPRTLSGLRPGEDGELFLPHYSHLLVNRDLLELLGMTALYPEMYGRLATKIMVGIEPIMKWVTYQCLDPGTLNGVSNWLTENGFSDNPSASANPGEEE
jgi:hypothetical protein